MLHLEQHPLATRLQRLFDVAIEAVGNVDRDSDSDDESDPDSTAAYDPALLQPLLDTLGLDLDAARPLLAVCPEHVNLRLNHVQDSRRDLVSLALGGGSCEWTNIKLAESMARIGTGRRVRASLLADISTDGQAAMLRGGDGEHLELEHPDSLAWVQEGLRETVLDGGTAAHLAPVLDGIRRQLPAGTKMVFLSKTGTPRKHDKGEDSAFYMFFVALSPNGETTHDGVSGAIYIEDRGPSSLAVSLAEAIVPLAVGWLSRQRRGSPKMTTIPGQSKKTRRDGPAVPPTVHRLLRHRGLLSLGVAVSTVAISLVLSQRHNIPWAVAAFGVVWLTLRAVDGAGPSRPKDLLAVGYVAHRLYALREPWDAAGFPSAVAQSLLGQRSQILASILQAYDEYTTPRRARHLLSIVLPLTLVQDRNRVGPLRKMIAAEVRKRAVACLRQERDLERIQCRGRSSERPLA